MGLRGVLAGALALIILQTLVQPDAAGRVAGLLDIPAQIARRIIDPTLPAIPELHPTMRGGTVDTGSVNAGGAKTAPTRNLTGRYPDPFTSPNAATGGE